MALRNEAGRECVCADGSWKGRDWLSLRGGACHCKDEDEEICARDGPVCHLRRKDVEVTLLEDGVGVGDCAHRHERG
jgi:hypothetical protein